MVITCCIASPYGCNTSGNVLGKVALTKIICAWAILFNNISILSTNESSVKVSASSKTKVETCKLDFVHHFLL